MLKTVSGQHSQSPGGGLAGLADLSVPPSTNTTLSVLPLDLGSALVKSPAAAQLGPQHILQQRQGSCKPGSSATPRTPQNLLAMVHLLDQQLQQIEQQYDGQQPAVAVQNTHMQGPQQREPSMEAPAVLSAAQYQAHGIVPTAVPHNSIAASGAQAGALAAAQLHGSRLAAHQELVSRTAAQLQQQHTLEVPSMLINAGMLAPHQHGGPQQLHPSNSHAAGIKAEAAAGGQQGLMQQQRQDQQAVDQVPQHNRGLMAAGAYVLQPVKSGPGAPKRRSGSPEEQAWLQHVDATATIRLPPVASAPKQIQQQRPVQTPQDFALQQAQQALAARAAAEAAANAAAAQEARPDQHTLLLQQRHMLQQQQQQQAVKLQQERQQRLRKPPLPSVQQQLPPRRPQQQQQQRRQIQGATEDMDTEDAAGALDMLSEIAAAAAAAEEMYAGVPSPMRPDLLNPQALAAAPGAFSNRANPVCKAPASRRTSEASGDAGAGAAAHNAAAAAAATNIPAAAAAAIAAAEHSTGSRGAQVKRTRGSNDGAASDAVAQVFAQSPANSGNSAHLASRDLKRTRMGDCHAAESRLQQQHSLSGRAPGTATDGAVVAESHAGDAVVPVARTGSNAGTAAAGGAGAPPAPAAIRAAVAELAALAAAAGMASQSAPMHAAPSAPAPVQKMSQAPPGMRAPAGTQAPAPAGAAGMPVAFLVRAPAATGNAAYLMYSAAPYAQQLQQRPPTAAGAPAAQAVPGPAADANSPVNVARRPAVKHAAPRGVTPPVGLASAAAAGAEEAAAANAADEAAHDLAMFAAAAAAAAAAGTYHRRPAAAPMATNQTHTAGRRQRKAAAAASAFIAAAVAATDDGMALLADDDGADEAKHSTARPHRRSQHHEHQQAQPEAAADLDMLAAAASSPDIATAVTDEGSAGAVAANPAAAAAGAVSHPRANTGRVRRGSSGSGSVYDHDYTDTEGSDGGGAYVCEQDGEQQDSDDEERQSGKNRSTKERVLSNRLAASRSYQRRKEEMLRLEHNHARLQVRQG